MRFIISGKFSDDVFNEAYEVVSLLREYLIESEIEEIPTALKSFVYFPVIISEEMLIGKKSCRSYSRNEEAEFVNVEIPHNLWVGANRAQRICLLIDGLRSALLGTKAIKISESAKAAIFKQLETLSNKFAARPPTV